MPLNDNGETNIDAAGGGLPEDDIKAAQRLTEAYKTIRAEMGKAIVGQSELKLALLLNAIKWAAAPVPDSQGSHKDDELHILHSEVRVLKEKLDQGQRQLRNRMSLLEAAIDGR